MRSERQALADIAKLCDEWDERTETHYELIREVQAILADVQPEPAPGGGTIDRDAIIAAVKQGLRDRNGRGDNGDIYGAIADRIIALVQPEIKV